MRLRPSPIEAVTFDFYNTLVYHRTGRGRGAMFMEYLAEQRLESDPWEHQALYDVFARHGVEYDPGQSPDWKTRYVRAFATSVFERLNVRVPEGAVAAHAQEAWNLLGPASLAVFPEVPAVLHRLRTAGYPLAVISNWQCGLGHFCTELGIGHAFDHVLASAEVGAAKPDSAIFREAVRLLGVAPHHILHIGDSEVDDYEGGRAAGLNVVLVCREPVTTDMDVPTISDLEGVPEILENVRRSRTD